MPQDDGLEPMGPQAGGGANLLYLASVLTLAGILLALFSTACVLLRDHPGHAPEVLPQMATGLGLGLLVLAAQAALVYFGLMRPRRQAARRAEELAKALDANSHRDALTGALNRTAFEHMLVRELDALRRYGAPFCGIMVDVDGFQPLSERVGYEAGDRLLRELAGLLQARLRKADVLFRWRVGRFLILAAGIGAEQAELLAARLRDLVAGHAFGRDLRITVCLGVAPAQGEDTPEIFVARVKAALAQAKDQGPGTVSGCALSA